MLWPGAWFPPRPSTRGPLVSSFQSPPFVSRVRRASRAADAVVVPLILQPPSAEHMGSSSTNSRSVYCCSPEAPVGAMASTESPNVATTMAVPQSRGCGGRHAILFHTTNVLMLHRELMTLRRCLGPRPGSRHAHLRVGLLFLLFNLRPMSREFVEHRLQRMPLLYPSSSNRRRRNILDRHRRTRARHIVVRRRPLSVLWRRRSHRMSRRRWPPPKAVDVEAVTRGLSTRHVT